jgi:glycosyltransferase involved in cell wall biosynthesis
VVCFIGHLRPYKQVVELIEAFRATPRGDAVLLVGGRPVDAGYEPAVQRAAAGDDRVRCDLGMLPDTEVAQWLSAANLVALPYKETLNSGAALLALSFDRPVLGPAQGAFAELAHDLGPQWVQTFDGPLTTAVLERALDAVPAQPPHLDLDRFSWPAIAQATVAAYRDAMKRRGRRS